MRFMLPKRWSREKRRRMRPLANRMTMDWSRHDGRRPPSGWKVTWDRERRSLMAVHHVP